MPQPKPLPPVERLHELFSYDGATLTRKPVAKRRRGQHENHPSTPTPFGYRRVWIDGSSYLVHRVIWKMLHGAEPPVVEHRHGAHAGDAEANLRAATQTLNCANCERPVRALPRGVHRRGRRFMAQMSVGNRTVYLGCFRTAAEASDAYTLATLRQHGEFAFTARGTDA